MNHLPKRGRTFGLLAVLILVVIGVIWAAKHKGSGGSHHEAQRVEFREVRPNDLAALEDWARQRCRGNSVEKLASALGLEPRLDVVVAHIARGLPAESRTLVEEVCRAELGRSAKRKPNSS